jgi:hypothetical protein
MKKTVLAGLLCGAMMASAAFAHHAPAIFDRTKEVKLVGVVKEFRWANPHSYIGLNVRDEKGTTATWDLEMNPVTYLVKAGWTSKTIKAGDAVTVMINPLRTTETVGKFVSITLPDGKVLLDAAR